MLTAVGDGRKRALSAVSLTNHVDGRKQRYRVKSMMGTGDFPKSIRVEAVLGEMVFGVFKN